MMHSEADRTHGMTPARTDTQAQAGRAPPGRLCRPARPQWGSPAGRQRCCRPGCGTAGSRAPPAPAGPGAWWPAGRGPEGGWTAARTCCRGCHLQRTGCLEARSSCLAAGRAWADGGPAGAPAAAPSQARPANGCRMQRSIPARSAADLVACACVRAGHHDSRPGAPWGTNSSQRLCCSASVVVMPSWRAADVLTYTTVAEAPNTCTRSTGRCRAAVLRTCRSLWANRCSLSCLRQHKRLRAGPGWGRHLESLFVVVGERLGHLRGRCAQTRAGARRDASCQCISRRLCQAAHRAKSEGGASGRNGLVQASRSSSIMTSSAIEARKAYCAVVWRCRWVSMLDLRRAAAT